MTYQQRFDAIQIKLATQNPDLGVAFLRAVFLSSVTFVFCAGVVFTVAPMAMNAWHWADVQLAGLNAWLWADPVTGYSMTLVTDMALMVGALWLTRHWLLLAAAWLLLLAAAWLLLHLDLGWRLILTGLGRKAAPSLTKLATAPNTDIVAG